MATGNVTQYHVITQLNETMRLLQAKREEQLRKCVIFCHLVSALPALSGTLVAQAAEGEPYELLVRGIGQLHKNITEIAQYADQLSQAS